MIRLIAFVSCYSLLLVSAACAIEYDIYFIGGQSNATGRGDTSQIPIGSPLANPQTDVEFYWQKTLTGVINGNLTQNQFIDLQPGSGHGRNSPAGHASEFGSELSFGRTLADAFPDRNTMIIKYSHGGSNLHTQWAAGGDMYNTFVDVVGDALVELDTLGATYNLKGMTWLQGESDTGQSGAYENNLVSLIDRVRTDVFAGENAPFVLTRLSDNQYSSLNSNINTIRAAQTNVPNLRPNVAYLDTDDDLLYTTYSNGLIHFDANAQINLGNALAQQMILMDSVVDPPTNEYSLFDAALENTTLFDNGAGGTGVNELTGVIGGLSLSSTYGTNHAFGINSTDDIDTLLSASPVGRNLLDTDTIRIKATVTNVTGDLNANGIEFGLAPNVGFRPDQHLLFQLDDNGGAAGLAHFPGNASSTFYPGVTNTNQAIWGAVESSLEDGFTIELVANKEGFTFTVTDAVFNDNGSATPGVFSGSFLGTEFIDNFGSGHLYFSSQKAGSAMTVNLSELSIEVETLASLPGDFNEDGSVDAADYTIWRDNLGSTVTPYTEGDADGNGIVDNADYDVWVTNYGAASASTSSKINAVPEPISMLLFLFGLFSYATLYR